MLPLQNFHHEIRFQLELANEHREFISGKKNGKINKIEKTANVKIKFETFNDYNFLITTSSLPASASPSSTGMSVGSTSAHAALHGLSLLQEELPAEVSFHVPEMYHKRIIGVGGKNIQRVMKKHGVYVKFANADEYAMLGGYPDNEDNVVARTPAKASSSSVLALEISQLVIDLPIFVSQNSPNLEQLKQAVMELVSPKVR
jgi:predicted PilT family ATPase